MLPGLGEAQFWGCSPCEGQLVRMERAQVWRLRTVNPLGYLDTHDCMHAHVYMHMCVAFWRPPAGNCAR